MRHPPGAIRHGPNTDPIQRSPFICEQPAKHILATATARGSSRRTPTGESLMQEAGIPNQTPAPGLRIETWGTQAFVDDQIWATRPLAQIMASVPATAFFPILLIGLVKIGGGLGIDSIALMLLGTQWYILFNVIAGAISIPSDVKEAAAVYRFTRWQRWTKLILPGISPYLITGRVPHRWVFFGEVEGLP